MAKKKEKFNSMKREELEKKLREFRESLRALKFKTEGAKTKNVKEPKEIRKNIARVLTAMNYVRGREGSQRASTSNVMNKE